MSKFNVSSICTNDKKAVLICSYALLHKLCIMISLVSLSYWESAVARFIQKILLQPVFKDFSRTTLDFQGPPTRNIISQIVQKCTFPVYSNKALRLELFASPTSLHFSVHLP